MDHDPATRFLVRLAKQGNKDAARDLALSVTYQQWDDANISRDNSACRTITKSSCNFDDEQCDLFDPLKGHGTYASLFRRWSSIAMAE